jgi:hypothetical protein
VHTYRSHLPFGTYRSQVGIAIKRFVEAGATTDVSEGLERLIATVTLTTTLTLSHISFTPLMHTSLSHLSSTPLVPTSLIHRCSRPRRPRT